MCDMKDTIDGGKMFGVLDHWHQHTKVQIDLDFIAHWFDRGVAKDALIQSLSNGFALRFKVLCFSDGNQFYEWRQSTPLPCRNYPEALQLANKLGIIKATPKTTQPHI